MPQMARKRAVVVAATLNVLCPDCGAEQPSPSNGSDNWLPSELEENTIVDLTCVSCDWKFKLIHEHKVNMP